LKLRALQDDGDVKRAALIRAVGAYDVRHTRQELVLGRDFRIAQHQAGLAEFLEVGADRQLRADSITVGIDMRHHHGAAALLERLPDPGNTGGCGAVSHSRRHVDPY
jgi:hypothetical protein